MKMQLYSEGEYEKYEKWTQKERERKVRKETRQGRNSAEGWRTMEIEENE